MHWIIQDDLHPEAGLYELRTVLSRLEIPHSFHRVPQGEGRLDPEISPEGRVFVIGGYSLSRIAQERGWAPGSLPVPGFRECLENWGEEMLNAPAGVTTTRAAAVLASQGSMIPSGPFFCRPVEDSKKFTGRVFYSWDEFIAWECRRPAVLCMFAPFLEIYRESRIWIVQDQVVTASTYKEGKRVFYDPLVSEDVLGYTRERALEWSPAPAYVMDIAETPRGLKIVEINNINAAGLYAANVGKLVMALEEGL